MGIESIELSFLEILEEESKDEFDDFVFERLVFAVSEELDEGVKQSFQDNMRRVRKSEQTFDKDLDDVQSKTLRLDLELVSKDVIKKDLVPFFDEFAIVIFVFEEDIGFIHAKSGQTQEFTGSPIVEFIPFSMENFEAGLYPIKHLFIGELVKQMHILCDFLSNIHLNRDFISGPQA